MNHRSWPSRLALLAALPLLLAGCGGDETSDSDDGAGDDKAGGTSFTAEQSGEAARVCVGDAMSNAGAYDPAEPGVVIFELARLSGNEPWTNRMTPSEPADFVVDGDDLGDITVVACAVGVEAHREDAIECEGDVSGGGTTTYRLAPIDWRVELREAATGEVIATADDLLTSPLDRCPVEYEPQEYEPGPGDPDATQEVVERLLAQA